MRPQPFSHLLGFFLLLASGCASQKPPRSMAADTALAEAPPPEDLQAAEAELQQAEQELARLIPPPAPPMAADAAGATADAEAAPAPMPAPVAAPVRKKTTAESVPMSASTESPCTRACRALVSMDRSAQRICQLLGEDSARCSQASQRVQEARERIERTCPSCG